MDVVETSPESSPPHDQTPQPQDKAKGCIADNALHEPLDGDQLDDGTRVIDQDNYESQHPDDVNTQHCGGKACPVPSPLVSPTCRSKGVLHATKAKLDLPPRWAGSVMVDIQGMDPKAVKLASRSEVALHSRVSYGVAASPSPNTEPEGLSLLDLDIAMLNTEVVLSSPRSVQACLRLGIQPQELVRRPVEVFQNDILQARARARKPAPGGGQAGAAVGAVQQGGASRLTETEQECCRIKHAHHEERRKQKYYSLVQERAVIVESADAIAASAPVRSQEENGLIAAEEKKLKKIVDANQAMLRQRLAHEHRMQGLKNDREEKLREQKELYDQQCEAQRKAEVRKEQEAELRQQLIKMRKSLEKREAEALLRKKEAVHASKERQRREELDRKNQEMEEQNRARAEETAERQRSIRTYNQQMQSEKRDQLITRIERNEQNKLRHEEQRRQHLAERKARALLKQAKIQAALERSQRVRDFKVERALLKEEKAQESLGLFHKTREKLLEEKRDVEKEKSVRRQAVYEESQRLLQARTNEILVRQRDQEHHFEEMRQRRADDGNMRWHLRTMQRHDKLENVARMKKVTEYKKYLTVERIEEKMQKAADMESERHKIKERRKRHREAIEAARVPIKRQTPGPGNYLGLGVPSTGHTSPQWKFGVSAANQAMRVIASEKISAGCAPGYIKSPGPCAYNTEAAVVADSSKRRNPCYTMSKADRFHTGAILA